MADALFVYGSLRFPDVLSVLIGRVPGREPATAEGWRIAPLPGRTYPGLVPDGTTADGFLLTGLTPRELRLFDAFEDPAYELKRLELVGGRHGWAYVWGAEAEPGHWSAEEFAQRHLPAFVEHCLEWRQRTRW